MIFILKIKVFCIYLISNKLSSIKVCLLRLMGGWGNRGMGSKFDGKLPRNAVIRSGEPSSPERMT